MQSGSVCVIAACSMQSGSAYVCLCDSLYNQISLMSFCCTRPFNLGPCMYDLVLFHAIWFHLCEYLQCSMIWHNWCMFRVPCNLAPFVYVLHCSMWFGSSHERFALIWLHLQTFYAGWLHFWVFPCLVRSCSINVCCCVIYAIQFHDFCVCVVLVDLPPFAFLLHCSAHSGSIYASGLTGYSGKGLHAQP